MRRALGVVTRRSVRAQLSPVAAVHARLMSSDRRHPADPTDVDFRAPDFGKYRAEVSAEEAQQGDVSRRAFAYMMVASAGFTYATMIKSGVRDVLDTMNASADVLALANVEVDLSNVEPGNGIKVSWRGKPLFIRHRAQSEIDAALAVDVNTLRDPQPDGVRHKEGKPEWLVLIGVCTHLGCVPLADAGDYGGYFCPCHGSHYDTSGRIRKGPAPLNLEIPPYKFLSDDEIIVGIE